MSIDLYSGYLNLGGNEIINNSRVWGLLNANNCAPVFVRNDCENLHVALDPDSPGYNTQPVQNAPWYDPDLPDVSSRFYGAYAIDVNQMHDSTREADVAQSLLDGGTIGRLRLATKEVPVRAMLFAADSEALEYGRTWLKWATYVQACGQHGDRCGLTDLQFFADCPPPMTTKEVQRIGDVTRTNYLTNPSFEAAVAGTAVLRTNTIPNPSFETGTADWVLDGATLARDTTDAFVGTACGKFTTTATVGGGYTTIPVTAEWPAGSRASGSVRVKAAPGTPMQAGISTLPDGLVGQQWVADGTWQLITLEGAAIKPNQTTGAYLYVLTNNAPVGTTFRIDAAIREHTATVGPYFDGATPDALGLDYGWSGTAHASTSTIKAAVTTTRTNWLVNPRMENSIVGWSFTAPVTLTAQPGGTRVGFPNAVTVWAAAMFNTPSTVASPGEVWSASMDVTVPVGQPAATLTLGVRAYTGATSVPNAESTAVTIQPGQTYRFIAPSATIPAGGDGVRMWLNVRPPGVAAGSYVIVKNALLEKVATPGAYFDGSTPSADSLIYLWSGTANQSASYQQGVQVAGWAGNAGAIPTRDTSEHVVGTASARVITSGAADSGVYSNPGGLGTWAAGMRVTARFRVKVPVGSAVTASLICLGGPTGSAPVVVTGNGAWQDVVLPAGTMPAGATSEPYLFIRPPGTHTPFTFWVDEAQIERAASVGPYFDGDTTDTPDSQYDWTGTAHASTSTYRPITYEMIPDPDTYQPIIDGLTRFLHGVAITVGPTTVQDYRFNTDLVGQEVEFTVESERPWSYGKTRTVDLPTTESSVIQDIPYNLAPYPSAEIDNGVAVVVARNLSTNPSVETNATGWTATATAGGGAGTTATVNVVETLQGQTAPNTSATATITTALLPTDRVVVMIVKNASSGTPNVTGLGATWVTDSSRATETDLYIFSATGITGGGVVTVNPVSAGFPAEWVVEVIRSSAAVAPVVTLIDNDGASAVVAGTIVSLTPAATAPAGSITYGLGFSGGGGTVFPAPSSLPASGWTTIRSSSTVSIIRRLNPTAVSTTLDLSSTAGSTLAAVRAAYYDSTVVGTGTNPAPYFTSGRSTDLAAAGGASFRARILGNGSTTVASSLAQIIIEHPVALGGTGTARRMSISGWAGTLIAAGGGASQIIGMRAVANWSSGGSVNLGTAVAGEFTGRVFAAKSVLVPDAATTVTLQFIYDVMWGSSATPANNSDLRVYADAVAVSVP